MSRTLSRIAISRRLAWFFGVGMPLAETIRRWGSWWDYPPAFLDDWLLGALLITGALAARNARSPRGRGLLAAAWGFACGIAYNSIATHWLIMQSGQADPAPIPTEAVFAIKIAAGLFFVAGLILAVTDRGVQPPPREQSG